VSTKIGSNLRDDLIQNALLMLNPKFSNDILAASTRRIHPLKGAIEILRRAFASDDFF
jgi:hypothetical protein